MLRMFSGTLSDRVQRSSNVLIALAFALSGLMPILLTAQAGAAQLTTRRVTISNSTPDATGVSYAFAFTTATAGNIGGLIFQFCNTPLGTCVLPGTDGTPTAAEKIDVSNGNVSIGTAWAGDDSTAFTEQTTDAGACNDADQAAGVTTMYCLTRTPGGSESAGAKTITLAGISNPIIASGNNEPVYVRITTFSDAAFATAVDAGTVAASIVNQLNVTGRVQERLVFCVFALDDTAGSSATVGSAATNMPGDCAANEATQSTSVDIGVVDNSSIAYAPVNNSPPASIGNDRFGAAIINTNASNGVAMSYYASQAASGTNELRAFRVSGATCNVSGTSLVDQCFISADNAGETVTAGTERFGMQLTCVVNTTTAASIGTTANLGKTAGTYTSGSGTSGSYNAAYNAGRTATLDDTGSHDCENNPTSLLNDKFAWNDTSTADPLISSTTVVDDEMVKFRFGATASATTPTGTYSVASTYIATPTF